MNLKAEARAMVADAILKLQDDYDGDVDCYGVVDSIKEMLLNDDKAEDIKEWLASRLREAIMIDLLGTITYEVDQMKL